MSFQEPEPNNPMLKFIGRGGLMPFREVYYSAFDLSLYHTCLNCPEGQNITEGYMRRTYFVPTYAQKCEICAALECKGADLQGIPLVCPDKQISEPYQPSG